MNETLNPVLPVLMVDDEQPILASYSMVLKLGGFTNTTSCPDSRKVISFLRENGAAVVLLDLQMPYLTGSDLLPQIVQEFPGLPVIVITGTDRVDTAVQCMKAGAFDFITKPVDHDRLLTTIKQALSFSELRTENRLLQEHLLGSGLKKPQAFSSIITNDPAMWAIFRYVEAIAPSAHPVLITGETGVGKELLARAVHEVSGRQGAFVAVNVAGVEENVFSDTLFGHARGAYTGADTARGGLVERAAGGTLFLDEIGDLSPVLQTKLLRLIQEHEYFPLGTDIASKTDARIVVATHQNLEALQQVDKFRKDLYYRLSTHRVNLPPLRDRLEDVSVLLGCFLEDAARQLDKKIPHCPMELIALLTAYDYPGNVRELQAMVFDAVSCNTTPVLSMEVFKERIFQKASGAPSRENSEVGRGVNERLAFGVKLPTMEEAKRQLITEALNRAGGNKTLAASILGMSRQALNLRERRQGESEE